MRLRDCIIIAYRNIRANGKIVRKMILGEVTILAMIISFAVIYLSYVAYRDGFDEKKFRSCYYILHDENLEYDNWKQCADSTKKKYDLDEVWSYAMIWGTPCGECSYVIDGATYKVTKYEGVYRAYCPSKDFESKSSRVDIGAAFDGGLLIPKVLGGNEKAMIAGAYPSNKSEILVDDYFLDHLGYTGDYESLIGKSISGNDIPDGMVISGVFSSEAVESAEVYVAHIIRYPRSDETFWCFMRGYYSDIERFTQKTKTRDLMHPDEGMEVTKPAFEYCMIHWIMTDLGVLLLMICGVIVMIMLFSIGYLMGFYKENRAKYLNMLSCVGMTAKDSRKIVFLEHNMYFLHTILFGNYAALILMIVFRAVVVALFDFAVVLSVGPFVVGTVALWILMNIMIYLLIARKSVSA
ncbi:MAG: hypothetical protein K6F17_08920 [Lachnospiraceae bacterium]|nr:hypothetical protein [Lachnospiraceae bacterium]